MKKETLQNLLHGFIPFREESMSESREELGFSFSLSVQERGDWFADDRHTEIRKRAHQEMEVLKLPNELAEYWICCFYSNYRQPNGMLDLPAIKGPPFLQIPCPTSFLSEGWTTSIRKVRSSLMSKHELNQEDDLIKWFWNLEAASEAGTVALSEVRNLRLPECYAMAWVCCFLPQGAK